MGTWRQLLEVLIDEPDMEWLMVDATYIKDPQAVGAVGKYLSHKGKMFRSSPGGWCGGRQSSHGADKRGRPTTKIHIAVDVHGLRSEL